MVEEALVKLNWLRQLLDKLISLSRETEWLEFKHNQVNPEEIGEYISALANSAALYNRDIAYLVYGVADNLQVVGTNFSPHKTKVKGQELESWLTNKLDPRVNFIIHEFDYNNLPIVLFEIHPTSQRPVGFDGIEYIRIGSYKKKLKDHPEKERALWLLTQQNTFEKEVIVKDVSADDVLTLIDYPSYFELTQQNLPSNKVGILEKLQKEKIIISTGQARYHITNLGAILFAKNLSEFESLKRKAPRVIIYKGNNRIDPLKEQPGSRGYASGFEGLIAYINNQLPSNEQIGQALRKEVKMYPEIAIRELVANALIHQDFRAKGNSTMIEIFADRIEITNPGKPLIDTLRFIDEPPQSRNEDLAAFMRRLHICEERGSGIDKTISAIEIFQLPAPNFIVTENHTKAMLYAYKPLAKMDKKDKVRACYQHACLCYVSNTQMNNASLRERFAIAETNYPIASRIIADTISEGLIKPYDPDNASRKHMRYIPFWA